MTDRRKDLFYAADDDDERQRRTEVTDSRSESVMGLIQNQNYSNAMTGAIRDTKIGLVGGDKNRNFILSHCKLLPRVLCAMRSGGGCVVCGKENEII